ncbi:hypothetical protein [Hymenobacter elongatus]|uniref:Lipoprotein n=1 Tax=Hymenobacter elongatus TaxID=877208 RepID=A0A4Z0PM61_9BACT|nr:hypothetical protein [Hymenobacter elongatus]TGE17550.1 hypothetical protein E5J99_06770 [Hymenobacter elongatus]
MTNVSACLLLATISGLTSCQPTPATDRPVPPAVTTSAMAAPTEAAARDAVHRYVQAQPNAALFVPDSAQVLRVDTHWQVLVPRTDWADRMPNKAAFEVDRQTGVVRALPVK